MSDEAVLQDEFAIAHDDDGDTGNFNKCTGNNNDFLFRETTMLLDNGSLYSYDTNDHFSSIGDSLNEHSNAMNDEIHVDEFFLSEKEFSSEAESTYSSIKIEKLSKLKTISENDESRGEKYFAAIQLHFPDALNYGSHSLIDPHLTAVSLKAKKYPTAAALLDEAVKKSSPSIIDSLLLNAAPLKEVTGRKRGAPRKTFDSLRALESKKN
jgi:hypothetical protein